MKKELKLIIKQVIAEELQQEGKGYLRGAALAGLLALGARGERPSEEQPPSIEVKHEKGYRAENPLQSQINAAKAALKSIFDQQGMREDDNVVRLERNELLLDIKSRLPTGEVSIQDLQNLNRLIKRSGISTEETEEFSRMLARR